MTNEAVLVFETHQPIQMTVSNSVGIEKGALLTLSDLMTAALCTTSGAATAGIAKSEKIASDGVTSLAVYRGGIFKVTASGAVTVGKGVIFEGGNVVLEADPTTDCYLAGTALETAANGETFLFELGPDRGKA